MAMRVVAGPVVQALVLVCVLAACSPGAPANVIELEIPEMATAEFRQGGQRVESIPVVAGEEYVFRVTNGSFDHNFFIGKAEDLAAREYDRLVGIPLWSSGTKEVRYTFKAGDQLQFACTLAGHYGPMHGDFVVEAAASAP
jgi:uncharacterized cupredoxin-like copper-binding protein